MKIEDVASAYAAVEWSQDAPELRRRWERSAAVRIISGRYVDAEVWRAASRRGRYLMTVAAHAQRAPASVFCCETALALYGVPQLGGPEIIRAATLGRGGAGIKRVAQASPRFGAANRGELPPKVSAHVHEYRRTENIAGIRVIPVVDAAAHVLSTATFVQGLVVADAILGTPRLIGALPCGHAPHVELFDGAPPPAGSEAVCAVQLIARRLHERTPAASRRRRALLALRHASPLAESPGESASRAILLAAGFPAPVLQAELRDHQGFIGRTDFWWPQQRIVGEFDGIAKYTDAGMTQGRSASSIIRAEKVREARLMAVSNRLFRWEWGDVMHPERLVAKALAVGLQPDPRRRFPGTGTGTGTGTGRASGERSGRERESR